MVRIWHLNTCVAAWKNYTFQLINNNNNNNNNNDNNDNNNNNNNNNNNDDDDDDDNDDHDKNDDNNKDFSFTQESKLSLRSALIQKDTKLSHVKEAWFNPILFASFFVTEALFSILGGTGVNCLDQGRGKTRTGTENRCSHNLQSGHLALWSADNCSIFPK